MRARRLPHRSTYILVFDTRGDLFVHLRTPTKDVYPSHWDPCAGGVLVPDEDFATGAARELAEELGVTAPLEELFPFRWEDPHNVVHGMVFRAVHDGPFRLQPEEVVRGDFLPLEMVEERARWEPFCPDGLAVVQEYRRRLSAPRR
jgi:8-oxo-dGTP pyrophosphatase MutT (NUDIX family)